MSATVQAEALWECDDCGWQGIADGVVATQPSTPDGPRWSEFYPERDRGGAFFAGCLNCGSENVYFDDVRQKSRRVDPPRDPVREAAERKVAAYCEEQARSGRGLPL